MSAYDFDASAAVKRYAQEVGTPWILNLVDPKQGHFLYVACITEVEVTSALARKRRDGFLTLTEAGAALTQFRKDLRQDYRVLDMTAGLILRASHLADRHVLRAYDAVQLASALEIQAVEPSLIFISADVGLNAAATAEGLTVEDPKNHP